MKWQIIDDKGVIFSGSQIQTLTKWLQLKTGEYYPNWIGEVKLVQVYDVMLMVNCKKLDLVKSTI